MWSSWDSYLTFFKYGLGLTIPEHRKYAAWEWLACTSGFRFLHKKFVMVCDNPEKIDRSLHNETGPTHRWRDGFSIWHINRIQVDEQIVMRPETQTIEQIESEQNADVKAVRIERFGWLRYISETGAREIDATENAIEGTYEELYTMPDGSKRFVATCPTGKIPVMGVPQEIETCEQARRWLCPEKVNLTFRT